MNLLVNNPWNNWRIGSFPENTNLMIGSSTGNVLDIQVWRHKDCEDIR